MDQTVLAIDHGWAIENSEHRAIYEKAEPFLQTRFNALHTRISYHLAAILVKKIGADPEVVFPAILLHDIGWSMIPESQRADAFGPNIKKPEIQRLHETEGARMAGEILIELEYPDTRIREIKKIITGHDTRPDSLNLNDAVVKDADKLWRYSSEGFAIDCERFGKTPRENLIWLIENLQKWFLTDDAKIMAHRAARQRESDYGIALD